VPRFSSIRRWCFWLLPGLLLFGCRADASELSRQFEALESFATAQFRQERHVVALSRPLVSSGSIELTAKGFIWKQSEPFAVWLTYVGVSIVEKSMIGGQETLRTVRDPATANLTRTMFEVMTGSFADLEAAFVIQLQEQPEDQEQTEDQKEPQNREPQYRWRYQLEPRDARVRNVISRIVLYGDDHLSGIRIEESLGNYTEIVLTDQRTDK